MAAPAPWQRSASSAHSWGVIGTLGLAVRGVASLRPTSTMTASRSTRLPRRPSVAIRTIREMKFGLFYEHQMPRPWEERSERQVFDEAMEQAELADRLG